MSFGVGVISVGQLTTNRRSSAEGTTTVNLPLTTTYFHFPSLCYIAMKAEPYKVKDCPEKGNPSSTPTNILELPAS
jgi:hypothetical protein